jgi:hypothetical protein
MRISPMSKGNFRRSNRVVFQNPIGITFRAGRDSRVLAHAHPDWIFCLQSGMCWEP